MKFFDNYCGASYTHRLIVILMVIAEQQIKVIKIYESKSEQSKIVCLSIFLVYIIDLMKRPKIKT